MATTIKIKQHDTKTLFTDTPFIDDVQVPVADMAGCTLSFLLKGVGVEIKATADLILSGTVAAFQYQPIASDVATIGKFRQEWEVVYPSGRILSFPNDSYNTVKILADLG